MLAEAAREKIARVVRPGGWNDLTVRALGPAITLTFNGVPTVAFAETDSVRSRSGAIALQLHHGPATEVRFRDIRTRPLDAGGHHPPE
jgi:hypothetical protein